MNVYDIVRAQQQGYVEFARWFVKSYGQPGEIAPGAILGLADWARFCRWGDTPWHPDPRTHALLTGRHEAMNRFVNHLCFTPDQLIQIRKIPFNKETDNV